MRKLLASLSLLLALSWASPAFPQPNRSEVVNGVANQRPQLLAVNSHESVAQFTQCAIAGMPERWDFLSKSAGENGYTWPNGVRTSHDVIVHHVSGIQVDIVANSTSDDGTPGRPTWIPIDPAVYRPSNTPVAPNAVPASLCSISSKPDVMPGSGGTIPTVGEHNTRLGVSLFWAMRGYVSYRTQLDANLAYIRDNLGADYVRVFFVLGGDKFRNPADGQLYDVWRDAAVNPTDPQLVNYAAEVTDYIYDRYGLKVHWVISGARFYMSTDANRELAVRLMAQALTGRMGKVELVEMVNEYDVNGFTEAEVQRMGRLAATLMPDFPRALSSPSKIHFDSSTESEIRAQIQRLYGGDNGGANVFTYHGSRPGFVWGPSSVRRLVGDVARRNSEPRGPGASSADISDSSVLAGDYVASIRAGESGYVYHTLPGIFGGHCVGFALQNRWVNLWDVPNAEAIATALRTLRHPSGTYPPGTPPTGGGTNPPGTVQPPSDPIALLLDLLRRVQVLEAACRAAGACQ